ncbi:MAG: hypothetical protein ACE10H_04800, partial [Candidatus Binatia bacterium]
LDPYHSGRRSKGDSIRQKNSWQDKRPQTKSHMVPMTTAASLTTPYNRQETKKEALGEGPLLIRNRLRDD